MDKHSMLKDKDQNIYVKVIDNKVLTIHRKGTNSCIRTDMLSTRIIALCWHVVNNVWSFKCS